MAFLGLNVTKHRLCFALQLLSISYFIQVWSQHGKRKISEGMSSVINGDKHSCHAFVMES